RSQVLRLVGSGESRATSFTRSTCSPRFLSTAPTSKQSVVLPTPCVPMKANLIMKPRILCCNPGRGWRLVGRLRAVGAVDPHRRARKGARRPREEPAAASTAVRLRGRRDGTLLLERRVSLLRGVLPA